MNILCFWVGGIVGFAVTVLFMCLLSANEITPENQVKKMFEKEKKEKKLINEKLSNVLKYAEEKNDIELMEIVK